MLYPNINAEIARAGFTKTGFARPLASAMTHSKAGNPANPKSQPKSSSRWLRYSTVRLTIFWALEETTQRKGVRLMEVIIKGDPKEIAALVLAVQGRQISVDEIMKQIPDQIASELSSVHIL